MSNLRVITLFIINHNINFKKKIANNHNILTNKLITTTNKLITIFTLTKKKIANNHNIVKTLLEISVV